MAYAIMGGLAGATLLTLVFVPALYVACFRIRRPDPAPERPEGPEQPHEISEPTELREMEAI